MSSLSALASTSALVCKNGSEISKVEAHNISRAKIEDQLIFDETLKETDLLQQVTKRLEKRSPTLALMFAKLYLEATDEDAIEIGKFVLPADGLAQIYRICENPNQVPELRGVSKKSSKLLIDERFYKKMNDLNRTAVILNEVIQRLNTKKVIKYVGFEIEEIEEAFVDGLNVKKYVSLLLAKEESSELDEWTNRLHLELVQKPIQGKRDYLIGSYYRAKSFVAAQLVLYDQRVFLEHGIVVKLDIKPEDLKPYQLGKMELDRKPFHAPDFIVPPALAVLTGKFTLLVAGGVATLGPVGAAIIVTSAGVAAGINTYSLIANANYKRKLGLVSEAYDLVEGGKEGGKLLKKFYRQFSEKVQGVSEIEYAERIVELARKNAFGKGVGEFVGARKMKEIILKSFE
jgi:hypothetical protein